MVIFLIAALIWQVRAPRYTPWVYWLTVVLVSVVGTQITDFLTDKLEISLYVSTAIFAVLLALTFAVWYSVERTLSIHTIVTTRRELFYWGAILFTFALGTAAGDLATEALSLGFNVGVLAFGALIALIAAAYYLGANEVLTFWLAYILTRPLGASLGDLLSQSREYGGVGLGTTYTSLAFLTVIVAFVEVTLGFWIIKILATTIGETGGDAVTMSLFHADKDAHNGGYLIGTGLFMAVFVACVIVQIAMKKFHPAAYWLTIVATTTVGTTMADFADRSLGIGYAGGSSLLFALLMASLLIWRGSEGSVSVNSVATPRAEAFYWTTILFSQTLGTALGDWMADTNGLGFGNASLVFGAALLILSAGCFFTSVSRVFLFWAAFILTRPLGATLGDLFDKPIGQGGVAINRFTATAILVAAMVALIAVLPQRPGIHPGSPSEIPAE
jgi:uncharacterized membrane-anchored protein